MDRSYGFRQFLFDYSLPKRKTVPHPCDITGLAKLTCDHCNIAQCVILCSIAKRSAVSPFLLLLRTKDCLKKITAITLRLLDHIRINLWPGKIQRMAKTLQEPCRTDTKIL